MNQVVQPLKSAITKTVEIVVHVNEELTEQERNDLTSTLKSTGGITDAEFCPLRWHLMLVRYDTAAYSSQDVLTNIASQNVHAQLLGPI
jgi:hypothetical protein